MLYTLWYKRSINSNWIMFNEYNDLHSVLLNMKILRNILPNTVWIKCPEFCF